jgi:hypothetical protein
MSDTAWNILINVVSSALVGTAVWLGQRALWRRRLRRRRQFFGLQPGADCLLVVNRHASGSERSVHRADVAALLQLSGLLYECGARPQVIFHDQATEGLGLRTEFCIGGPSSNARTAAHLRRGLPGVTIGPYARDEDSLTIRVASWAYPCEHDVAEYAVLARIAGPAQERPVFVVSGQTAIANQGAVGYLVSHRRDLVRAHGLEGRFCLVLRVVEPPVYGPNLVELVRDVTAEAFAAPAPAAAPD